MQRNHIKSAWHHIFFAVVIFVTYAFAVLCIGRNATAALGAIEILPVFTNLSFFSPLFLTHAGDGSNRIFVVERTGRIKVFANDPNVSVASTFLDLSGVVGSGGELGLLGLAFDPGYVSNGYFYVDYATGATGACPNGWTYCTKIVRYKVSSGDANRADPTSAQVLLQLEQPASNHDGGMLAFGPGDGRLYIGLGDGGIQAGQNTNPQDCSTLLGSVLRIQPETAGGYSIPSDNPFAAASDPNDLCADEIWLYGLRNPWRFSFDRQAPHDLWIGDVGETSWEEIDWIAADAGGLNLGWNVCEGMHAYPPGPDDTACQPGNGSGYTTPVLEHPTGSWHSVTGGYVYRGRRQPSLRGYYVYADYEGPKNVWAWDGTTTDPLTGLGVPETIGENFSQVASLGEDESGELYILSLAGNIYVVPEPSLALLRVASLSALLVVARFRRRSMRPV